MRRTFLTRTIMAAAVAGALVSLAVAADAPTAKQGYATIRGAGDNEKSIKGTALFTSEAEGVKIVINVEGLSPGKHGIHIHQGKDLSKPDLSGAGPHFNPGGGDHQHSGPDDPRRHAGDLGNIEVDDKGHGHLEISDTELTIDATKNGVVGHSIIIHEKEDDLKSQPAGESGKKIAGGVINLRNAAGRQPDNSK